MLFLLIHSYTYIHVCIVFLACAFIYMSISWPYISHNEEFNAIVGL